MKKLTTKNIETIFKCVYLMHLLLAFNAIVNRTPYLKITLVLTLLSGAVVAVLKVRNITSYFSYKNGWLLNLFIVSYVVSSIVNYKYGIMDNMQGFIWLCAQIWILYLVNKDLSKEDIKKEFELLIKIFLIMVTVYNLISLGMFFFHYTVTDFSNGQYILGFIWGRLWGVYDDPNHGSVISVSAMLAGIYLYQLYKNKWIKILMCISLFVQGLYVYLSDSRTGIICMAVGCAIMFAYWIYTKVTSKKILCTIAAFVGGMVLLMVMEAPVQKTMAVAYNSVEITLEESWMKNDGKVGRDDMEEDPSNRRFDIWKSGIEIFNESKIFGVGRFNFLNFAEENLPDTYIINNNLQKFDSMHNMPLDVLVSQGLIGIFILLAVVINSVICIGKNIAVWDEKYALLGICLFAIIIANGVSSIFLSTVVYINSPATYIFWASFGYFMRIMKLQDNK